MPYSHVEMAVSAWARDYAESLTPGMTTVLSRLDSLQDNSSLDGYAFNVAEFQIEDLLYTYSRPGTPYLVVYELPHDKSGSEDSNANAHYHVFMELSGTIGALRAAIKRTWTGNAGYSLKQGKPELVAQQFNYLCKGSGTGTEDAPNVIYRSDDLTDATIQQCHALYWQNNDAIQMQKSKRQRVIPVSEIIYNKCLDLHTGSNKKKIFQVVKNHYLSNIKYLNPSYVRNLVWQTAVYLDPEGQTALDLETYCCSTPY